MLPALEWRNDRLVMIDQRKLPLKEIYLEYSEHSAVARAIETMVVRGAPAIGVAAAYGVALGVLELESAAGLDRRFEADLSAARADAADRPKPLLGARADATRLRGEQGPRRWPASSGRCVAEARAIEREDVATNKAIGRHGRDLIKDGWTVLTHCNAGELATAGYGTAVGVIRAAHEQGKKIRVFADETRPFLQGARLTCWELDRRGIPVVLITDNMAGWFMKKGEIQAVVVGADRIARNGDTANKIGTYSVAVLAREHGIPFYVAAPMSTVDASLETGAGIPIEERQRAGGPGGRRPLRHAPRHRRPQSGLRRDPGEIHHRHHHRERRLPPALPLQAVNGRGAAILVYWCSHVCPRHRNVLRRNVGRRPDGPVRGPEQHRPVPGRGPRPLRRRRSGARLAPAHPVHRPRRRRGAGEGRSRARGHRRLRRDAGSRAHRLAPRRALVRQGPGLLSTETALRSRPSRGPYRGRLPGKPGYRFPGPGAPRVRRPHVALSGSKRSCPTGSSARRATTRPGRRSTRSPSSWASAIRAVRSSRSWPSGGDPKAFAFARPRIKDAPYDFSFSGLKTAAIRHIRESGVAKDGPRLRRFPGELRGGCGPGPRREGRPGLSRSTTRSPWCSAAGSPATSAFGPVSRSRPRA